MIVCLVTQGEGGRREEEESGIGGVAARLDLRSSSAAVVDAKCS